MNYLNKNKGISSRSLEKIAKVFKKSQEGQDKFGLLDTLRQYMDDTQILDELMQAMSDQEAQENLGYIMQMWDIGSEGGEV